VREIAIAAFRAVDCSGMARVDFFIEDGKVILNEINTIPGFTPISLFPTMPAEGGHSFTDVCLRIVQLAIERHAARPAARLGSGDLPR
jgi:D-alanine-D-alanine ligase